MGLYYTKCGIEFSKSTNATVTGYRMDLEKHPKCKNCPFKRDIYETYPVRIFKYYECRAGSKPVNFKREYTGRLDDKNNIQILGHHPQFTDDVINFAKSTEGVMYADYSGDDTSDNRRTVIITIEKNKKGVRAKEIIVNKFFGENAPVYKDNLNHKISNDPLEGVNMFQYIRNLLESK